MIINVEEYFEKMREFYYSEPDTYEPENDCALSAEEIVLISHIFYFKRLGRKTFDTDDISEYSYYEFDYIEWIATLDKNLAVAKNVDWSKVLKSKKGCKTELFSNHCHLNRSPWWTSDKYKERYQEHREECKKYWYLAFKEEEKRKAHQKAATALERCRKKAEKDLKNGN